jgi:hypothetical protein
LCDQKQPAKCHDSEIDQELEERATTLALKKQKRKFKNRNQKS